MFFHNQTEVTGGIVHRGLWVLLVVLGATACCAPSARGQIDQTGVVTTRAGTTLTANYYFARPNDITIIVSVIGAVQKPGRYEVSRTIDLLNLLALAGGPTADGSYGDIVITREAQISGRSRFRDIYIDLEDASELTAAELVLFPGDVIRVNRTGWAAQRDWFNVVVGLAIITGAVAQVMIATQ